MRDHYLAAGSVFIIAYNLYKKRTQRSRTTAAVWGKSGKAPIMVMRIGLEKMQPSFPVPHLEMETLSQIFTQLRLDHPKMFYVAVFSRRTYLTAVSMEFISRCLFHRGSRHTDG